ncbi:MAG: Uxx-star family glutaredoxin-like (seleno)protein [Chloroflexota bacterium]|nr:Uxx-star family glutaredoxin-like (seleno)protein [Chloroflexota bacterium]
MDVTVYTTATCPYCHHVKDYLRKRGVQFVERDVSTDREAAEDMVRKSGQMGVPVTIMGDQVVVGFDRPGLERLVARKGDGGRVSLGLKVADASKMAARFGLVPVLGALVGGVAPSSIGERAGVRSGDIITEVNLRPTRNAEDREEALAGLKAGSRVVMVLRRGETTLKSEVVV